VSGFVIDRRRLLGGLLIIAAPVGSVQAAPTAPVAIRTYRRRALTLGAARSMPLRPSFG